MPSSCRPRANTNKLRLILRAVKILRSFGFKDDNRTTSKMSCDDKFCDLKPITNEDFNKIINIILANAFQKNYSKLISRISSCVPNYMEIFSVSHRQILIFLSFYRKWRETGPLPDLRHYKFLLTLHDAVSGILRRHREILDKMPRPDLIKLVTGLRTLLGKAILLEEKFVIKDVETLIMKYYPVLPVTNNNRTYWRSLTELLGINQENKEDMQIVSRVNKITRNHLNQGLLNLAKERKRNVADLDVSFLSIFETIEPKLSAFINLIEDIIPENYPQNLISNLDPQNKAVFENIDLNSEENQLIQEFESIMNFRIESHFWTSDMISQKFDSNP